MKDRFESIRSFEIMYKFNTHDTRAQFRVIYKSQVYLVESRI